jgi:biopolymer transport protein ExbD
MPFFYTMKLTSGYENRSARLEMISLMDVMFLILVFFVYSIFSMSVHRAIKVNLPAATGTHEKGEMTMVTLTAENILYLNKRPMKMDDLVPAAAGLWKEKKLPVMISADQKAELGVGIELLSKLKKSGVERVAFQVEEKQKE